MTKDSLSVSPDLSEELMANAIMRLSLDRKVGNEDYEHEDAHAAFRLRGLAYVADCSWKVTDGKVDFLLEVYELIPPAKGKRKVNKELVLSRQFEGSLEDEKEE